MENNQNELPSKHKQELKGEHNDSKEYQQPPQQQPPYQNGDQSLPIDQKINGQQFNQYSGQQMQQQQFSNQRQQVPPHAQQNGHFSQQMPQQPNGRGGPMPGQQYLPQQQQYPQNIQQQQQQFRAQQGHPGSYPPQFNPHLAHQMSQMQQIQSQMQLQQYQEYQQEHNRALQQEKRQKQQHMLISMGNRDIEGTNILDKMRVQEMCSEICGRSDVLDDRVSNALAVMVDQMVENVVDFSCMYATHRDSDTLEKEDVAFAVSKLFPEIARDHKVRDVQLVIDQQVNLNHSQIKKTQNANQVAEGPQPHTSSIGVAGQISTANYKSQLMRVRKEQEQQMAITNVTESLKQQVQNMNNRNGGRSENYPGDGQKALGDQTSNLEQTQRNGS